jgi:hypothetical protein
MVARTVATLLEIEPSRRMPTAAVQQRMGSATQSVSPGAERSDAETQEPAAVWTRESVRQDSPREIREGGAFAGGRDRGLALLVVEGSMGG